MWIFWATLAMLGSTAWYVAPKIFPTKNYFSVFVLWGIISFFLGIFGSKIQHGQWFDTSGFATGALMSLSTLGTIGLILAFNSGGKMGPISVIIEISVVLAALISYFWFRESLNPWQIFGMFLAISGVCLVVFFEK